MDVKQIIAEKLQEKGIEVSVENLRRYINAERNPDIDTSVALAQILGGDAIIWQDKRERNKRRDKTKVYADKIGAAFYQHRGRPRIQQ